MNQAAIYRESYRLMIVIRTFEEKVNDSFLRGKITGTAHLCVGQEAVAVGACRALRAGDYITSTHCGHGHFLARGADPARIMAEMFGKRTGYSGGRGGSQLMADYRLGFLGANGITGGGLPLATGVALASKMRGNGKVVLCFFGDGASNQGTFHESLNMAAIWKLPIVYLCENNLYGMSTSIHYAAHVTDLAVRATGYGLPGEVVDGNDLLAVGAAVTAAAQRARQGEGPTLLECKTYRQLGHSRGDPRRYRTPAEERAWKAKDPIRRFRALLRERKMLTPAQDRKIRSAAVDVVRKAVRFAQASPWPDTGTLEEGVFA